MRVRGALDNAAGRADNSPTVAVIGAGAAGLVSCKALRDRGIETTCFESSDDVGGTWYFGNPNGQNSIYRSLHINISRASVSFRDFPMPEGPDFPHHSVMHEYLRDYVDHFDLRQTIRFETTVESAKLEPEGWRLSLADGVEERFDALVVCNGHHWDPTYPDPPFPGYFSGETIHAHDYIDPRNPLDLEGKRVLVVGIGNSGVDIASELSRQGCAKRVVLSTRSGAWIVPKYAFGRPFDQLAKTNPWLPLALQRFGASLLVRALNGHPRRYGLPEPDHRFLEADPTLSEEVLLRLGSGDLVARPNISELRGESVRFVDGREESFDAIIYATGYRVSFPFFDPELISAPGNVLPLYKRLFKPGIDNLAFVGLAEPLPSQFIFAELQARLVAMWLDGEWELPEVAEMEAAIAADDKKMVSHYAPRPRHTMHHLVPVYERDLAKRVIPAGRRRASRVKSRVVA